jgi:hypothetical protein
MKISKALATTLVAIAMVTAVAFADQIRVDYDHSVNFDNYRTYSWAKVETSNPFLDARVKDAINRELAAKGWTQVSSGANVALVAVQMTRTRRRVNTFYDGFGGGFGYGFYDGFGDGAGESTTTVQHYKVGTLVIDMFDASSKKLIWRGASASACSGNPEKNTRHLDKEVQKMFQHFPPRAAS